jgi:hypothetical protein
MTMSGQEVAGRLLVMEIGAGNERIFGGDLMIMAIRKGCVFYPRVV